MLLSLQATDLICNGNMLFFFRLSKPDAALMLAPCRPLEPAAGIQSLHVHLYQKLAWITSLASSLLPIIREQHRQSAAELKHASLSLGMQGGMQERQISGAWHMAST